MTDLSPAAQAVYDAYCEQADNPCYFECSGLVAALRAAADQLLMSEPLGDTDADAGVFAAHHAIHTWLFAIAAELEQLDD
jgi:hypothetical protein